MIGSFFLIYVNVTLEYNLMFWFLLYADDTPHVGHTNVNDGVSSYSAISIINSELAEVNDWLAVKKTKYNFFASVKKTPSDFSLYRAQIFNASETSIS